MTVTSGIAHDELRRTLAPFVELGESEIALDQLEHEYETRLVPHLMDYGSVSFQSMFNALPEPAALWGQAEVAKWNQGVTAWQVSPGGATLEEMVCEQMCALFGWGPGAEATFMYSGTYANQEAIFLALQRYGDRHGVDLGREGLLSLPAGLRPRVLASTEAHLSISAAVRMLGLGEDCVVRIPTDRERRIDLAEAGRLAGEHEVCCIVATAGTTNTGAVDPLSGLREIADAHQAWLHVDGAYGLSYALVPENERLFRGLTTADSATWDPHKAMGVPIPNSLLFCRNGKEFRRVAVYGAYFNQKESTLPAPGLKSPPTTRPMQALPLIASIRHLGLRRLRDRLKAPLDACHGFYEWLLEQDDFEVAHEPRLGIVCFRFVGHGTDEDRLNASLFNEMMRRGERSIASTRLDGKTFLRVVVVNPATTAKDLIDTGIALRALIDVGAALDRGGVGA